MKTADWEKINCLISYLESWDKSEIPVIAPFELTYLIKEANEWLKELQEQSKATESIYKKVVIKSEDDLPKDGNYIAHYKKFDIDSPAGTIISNYSHLNLPKKLNWLTHIDWYLLPVGQEQSVQGPKVKGDNDLQNQK